MRGLYHNLLPPTPRSILFLEDFSAGMKPSRLKARTSAPGREQVTLDTARGPLLLDLYNPARGAVRAGLLLVPGVARLGKDDPRLVGLADTMARMGFAVVIPDLKSLRELVVRPDHYLDLVDAFQFMLTREDLAPRGRAGMGGMSFAMGPTLKAVLTPELSGRVKFLFCTGGYFDILSTVTFVTTGCFKREDGGGWHHLGADHYGRWVLVSSMAIYLEDAEARAAVQEMVSRRIPDAQADISDLLARATTPDARALLALEATRDPDAVPAAYAALPRPMRDALDAMDLSRLDLEALKTRLILIHGYDDALIPFAESATLYKRAKGKHRLYLIKGLSHVNLDKPGWLDIWGLMSAMTALLREQGPG